MRRIFAVLAVCLMPILAFLAYSEDIPALPTLNQDASMGTHWGIHVRSGDDVTAYLDTAGISAIRIGFRWQLIEKDGDAPDTADFNPDAQFIKDQVRAARAEGMIPVALLDGKPVWIEDCGADHPENDDNALFAQGACVPRDSGGEWDEYREFIDFIHSEFDSIVDHWELWNETFSDGTESSHERGLLFNRPPRALDSIVKIASGILGGSGEVIICCGFKDEGTIWKFTTQVTNDSVDDRTDQDWITTFANRWDNEVDVISVHHYDSIQGGFIKAEIEEVVNDLNTGGAPQTVWLTEFGIGCRDNTTPAEDVQCDSTLIKEESSPREWAQTIRTVHNAMNGEPGWEKSFYFTYQRSNGYRNILFHSGTDPVQVDSVKEAPHCAFVSSAGNENQDGTCPDVTGISGHDMGQTVPPNTTCTHAATGETGGTTPYYYYWYVDGVLEKESSEDHISVFTPSSGSYTVKVVLEDANKAQAEYSETMTVDSNAMCPQ